MKAKRFNNLDSGKDDSGVGVSQTRGHTLTRRLSLTIVLGCVAGKTVENEHLPPFRAFVESRKKLINGGRVHIHDLEMRGCLGDF